MTHKENCRCIVGKQGRQSHEKATDNDKGKTIHQQDEVAANKNKISSEQCNLEKIIYILNKAAGGV